MLGATVSNVELYAPLTAFQQNPWLNEISVT